MKMKVIKVNKKTVGRLQLGDYNLVNKEFKNVHDPLGENNSMKITVNVGHT